MSYSWSQTAGTSVMLTSTDSAATSFTSPAVDADETLTFELTVTDDDGATDSDTVSITVRSAVVENSSPTVNAGIDQSVDEFSTVTLNGSATDSDGSIVSYQWTQLSGGSVVLSNADSDSASFTAPDVISSENLTFQLTVTDDNGATGVDSVTVTINPVSTNTPPTADAGGNQAVVAGATVTLDGSNSTDTETTNLDFSWTQTSGSMVTLSSTDQAIVTFSAPNSSETLSFELTVTDEEGISSEDTVIVTVQAAITEKINDTGVTFCGDYDSAGGAGGSNSEDCADTISSNGFPIPDGQDAGYGRDKTANDDSDGHAGFSFTKLDSDGNPLPANAMEWSCVKDNVTGLIWEVKTDDDGLRDKDNKYTWYNSDTSTNGGSVGTLDGGICPDEGSCDTESYINAVNDLGLCGENGWRLPSKNELLSLLNYEKLSAPDYGMDTRYFPYHSDSYWTSTPVSDVFYDDHAWVIKFPIGYGLKKSKGDWAFGRARLVRTP
ncbi:MAG: DUF1566 domain-containing protein [Gammaproteobacteria bacterium]|nr:DUF1566 domain-containing protein [Gammaproteobacteria bacterium]